MRRSVVVRGCHDLARILGCILDQPWVACPCLLLDRAVGFMNIFVFCVFNRRARMLAFFALEHTQPHR